MTEEKLKEQWLPMLSIILGTNSERKYLGITDLICLRLTTTTTKKLTVIQSQDVICNAWSLLVVLTLGK